MNSTLIALACNLCLPIAAPPAVLAPVGWDDCNHNGNPDDEEPYHDCNANDVQDICDIAEGNSADCNRSGVLDECELLRFWEAAVPGLSGYYGGHKGLPRGGEGRYDFGRRFLLVRAAWLDFEIVYTYPDGLPTLRAELNGIADPKPRWDYDGAHLTCPALPLSGALPEGDGHVRIELGFGCCDFGATITDSSIWFDGIAVDSAASLLGFAEFQTCFGADVVSGQDACVVFDVNADGAVDAGDYATIYPPSQEP